MPTPYNHKAIEKKVAYTLERASGECSGRRERKA